MSLWRGEFKINWTGEKHDIYMVECNRMRVKLSVFNGFSTDNEVVSFCNGYKYYLENSGHCVSPASGFFFCILHVIQNRAHSDFKAPFYNEKQPRVSSLCSLLIEHLKFICRHGDGFCRKSCSLFPKMPQPNIWTVSLKWRIRLW